MHRKIRHCLSTLLACGCLLLALPGTGFADTGTIKFAEPSWPGVNVKTEVVSQLLQTLGYQVKTSQLNLAFVYNGLKTGSTDVFLAAWLPTNRAMLEPAVKKKQIIKLTRNLSGAIEGLAVPDYVWSKGIHSVKDLAAHGAMFDHKIYGIESGSAMNKAFNAAIKNNYEGLGGWKVVPSSTAVMLAQVQRTTGQKKPIVFFGWRPHWMNIKFHIRYLKDKKDSKIASIKSQVFTVVTADFPKKHPNVTRLLRQVHVKAATQSAWINQYSHEKKPKKEVATTWLKGHKNTVLKWLDGVKTASGGSATAAYKKQYL